MKFFDRLKVGLQVLMGKEVNASALIDQALAGGQVGETFLSRARNGYARNGVIFSAIQKIVRALGEIPWCLYQRARDGKDTELLEHPAIQLIERPNPLQAKAAFLEQLVVNLYHAGISPVKRVDAKGLDTEARPHRLWALRPDLCSPVDPQNLETDWYYQPVERGPMERLTREQLRIFSILDPESLLKGVSPIHVASTFADQTNFACRWNLSLLKNGGRPSGALKGKFPIPDKAKREEYRTEFETQIQGDGIGRPIFLPGEIEFEPYGINPHDMEWLAGLVVAMRMTAITMGTPPQLLGDKDAATFANYQEARRAFYEETVIPLGVMIVGEFNEWLLPSFGEDLYFKLDLDSVDALHEARKDEWGRIDASEDLTVNEKRDAKGYEAIEGPAGDLIVLKSAGIVITGEGEILVPTTLIPIDQVGELPDEPPVPPPAGGEPPGDKPPPKEPPPEEDQEDPPKAGGEVLDHRAFNLRGEAAKGMFWKSFDRSRASFKKMARYLVAKRLGEDRRAVVAAVKSGGGGAVDAAVDKGRAAWQKTYQRIYGTIGGHFARQTLRALPKGALLALDVKADGIVDRWMRYVQETIARQVGDKITGIVETTKERVKRSVSAGVEAGEGIDEIAKRIDQLFLDEIIPNRSEVIARTETIAAANAGGDFAARSTGLPLKKEWIATRDDRTRDDHWEVNGKTVGMDDPFVVGGDRLMFPGDSSLGAGPGNVINCRCTTAWQVVGE